MKNFISILFLTCTTTLFSQSWPWATVPTGTLFAGDEASAVSMDPAENLYFSGLLTGTLICGTNTLVNTGTCSMLVIKMDPFGNVLWGKSSTDLGSYAFNSIATDNSGNSLVAGSFSSPTVSIGSVTLNLSGTCSNVILAKFDTNGNLLWAQSSNGNACDTANAVSVDATGNYYVTGSYSSSNFSLGTYTITNATSTEMVFVAKIDPSGNIMWLRNGVSSFSGKSWGNSIAADAAGNCMITGDYSGTLTLGTYTLVASAGTQNVFYAKYDTNGNVIWANTSGGSSKDNGTSVCTDVSGNYYLTGNYKSPVLSLGTFTLGNSGLYSMFVAKLDGNGNVLWAQNSTGGGENGLSISSSPSAVYVTGAFYSTSFSFNTYTIVFPPTAMWDPSFIMKLDPNGNVLCADALTSGGDDKLGIVAGASGNYAYVAGDFRDPLPFIVGTYSLTYTGPPNSESIFAAKFQCSSVGIQNFINSPYNFSLYPIPSNGTFYLNAETETESGQIIIFNLLGEKVFEQKLSGNLNTIATNLPDGIYTYKILNKDNPAAAGKLLVNR
jgi:hypothetical protein